MKRYTLIGIGALAALIMMTVIGCGGGPGTSGGDGLVLVELGRITSDTRKLTITGSGDIATTLETNKDFFSSTPRAYLWTRGVFQEIHPPDALPYSMAMDSNNNGQIALVASNHVFGDDPEAIQFRATTRAYLFDRGTYTEIRVPGYPYTRVIPTEISESGTVIGICWVGDNEISPTKKLFIWRDGETSVPDGSAIRGINTHGQVLLSRVNAVGTFHEWHLRNPDGTTTRLTDLATGAEKFIPARIADDGAIYGTNPTPASNDGVPSVIRNGVLLPDTAPVVRYDNRFPELQQRGNVSETNQRGQAVGAYTTDEGERRVFLITPRNLAPPTGTATITLKGAEHGPVDESLWITRRVTGSMLYDRILQATVAAHATAVGTREFTVSLVVPENIQAGQSYAVHGTAEKGSPGGVSFFSDWKNIETTYAGRSGTLVVESITPRSVTFRLVNIQIGSLNAPPGADFAFLLNGQVTVGR